MFHFRVPNIRALYSCNKMNGTTTQATEDASKIGFSLFVGLIGFLVQLGMFAMAFFRYSRGSKDGPVEVTVAENAEDLCVRVCGRCSPPHHFIKHTMLLTSLFVTNELLYLLFKEHSPLFFSSTISQFVLVFYFGYKRWVVSNLSQLGFFLFMGVALAAGYAELTCYCGAFALSLSCIEWLSVPLLDILIVFQLCHDMYEHLFLCLVDLASPPRPLHNYDPVQ